MHTTIISLRVQSKNVLFCVCVLSVLYEFYFICIPWNLLLEKNWACRKLIYTYLTNESEGISCGSVKCLCCTPSPCPFLSYTKGLQSFLMLPKIFFRTNHRLTFWTFLNLKTPSFLWTVYYMYFSVSSSGMNLSLEKL